MKKIMAVLLTTATLLSLASCDAQTVITEETTEDETANASTETTGEIIPDTSPSETEEAVILTPSDDAVPSAAEIDLSGSDWASTIKYASKSANGVQAGYTDGTRQNFKFGNLNSTWVYEQSESGRMNVKSLTNSKGYPFIANAMDAFAVKDGKYYYASNSLSSARMNAFRIGYYYYDVHFLGQDLVSDTEKDDRDDFIDLLDGKRSWLSNQATIKRKDGVLNVTVKATEDPYIHTSGLSIDTSEYKTVQITMKTEAAATVQLYLVAGEYTGFNGDQIATFSVTPGVEKTYIVPLSTVTDYTGLLKGFRMDFSGKTGEQIIVSAIKFVKSSDVSLPLKLERTFHTFPDKLHEEIRFLATEDITVPDTLGSVTEIPCENVYSFIIGDGRGEHTSLDGVDFSTCRYVAFDIKGAGVFGIIMPKAEDNGTLRVALEDGVYKIYREYTPKGDIPLGGSVIIGHRIYTSDEHLFNPFRKAVYEEENPLQAVYAASATDGTRYLGYEPFDGVYRFYVNGSDFNSAYYRSPDKYFRTTGLLAGDGVADRSVYIKVETNAGCLEGAAITDDGGRLLPIGLEVCKNFCGEKEEPLFYPEDTAYGEVYFPLTVKADEGKKFTVFTLYQNWGGAPLKQLSSIQFHISYYHLSVGVTETNCIAPYFVYGKDVWTLPDFRALSSPLWPSQPQHTSAGRIYFLEYTDSKGNYHNSESQNANILSAGPIYADVEMDYISDDGKLFTKYRHTEHPQTDETRTYYQIRLTALDDIEIEDFKKDFSFVSFDGRSVVYTKMGYLDKDGSSVTAELDVSGKHTNYIELGKEYPYFSLYDSRDGGDTVNMALIVKGSEFIIGGEKQDCGFILVESYDMMVNRLALTLDLGKVTLKKGDTLSLDIILLPWGDSNSQTDKNVTDVRYDSCVSPYTVKASVGEAVDDPIVPSVRAEDGTARFVISGGKNTAAVRIYGFDSYIKPTVYEIIDGKEVEYKYSPSGFDGYQVYSDGDGSYSFAFRIDMKDDGGAREFIVKQGK